jgi:hypothetical protein
VASPSYQSADTSELRVFIVVGLGILIVLICLVSRFTGTNARPAFTASVSPQYKGPQVDYMRHPDEASARVDTLAQQTDGDFDQLTLADQRWLDSMTSGHGRNLLARRAGELKERARAEKRRLSKKTSP